MAPNQTPGRRFQPTVERSLDPALALVASSWGSVGAGQRLLLTECALPFGIPDMLLVELDDDAFRNRVDAGWPAFTSPIDAQILAACASRPRRRWSLAHGLGTSAVQAERTISRLVRLGAIDDLSGRLRTVPELAPIGRVSALEAKVTDWRSGLEQCLRYGVYAEATALILGKRPGAGLPDLQDFAKRHGVGVSHGG